MTITPHVPQPATIWKYTLPITDEHVLEIPQPWKPLSVDIDPSGQVISLWAWVMPDSPSVPRQFYIRGTGHPLFPAMPSGFIGTVVDRPTGLVWHVFDGGPA